MNRNKVACVIVGLIALAHTGFSAVFIDFSNLGGIFTDASFTPLPSGALVQLIWSPDNQYSATPVQGSIPSTGSTYGGTDYVLYQAATTEAYGWGITTPADFDGAVGYTDSNVGGAGVTETIFSSGYVYAYVFQHTVPVAGDYYGRLSMVKVPTRDPGNGSIAPCSLDTAGLIVGPAGQNLQVQAVPEPSTVGLLLVGAGLVAMRRFRRG